jgi:putative transcriptional regulator
VGGAVVKHKGFVFGSLLAITLAASHVAPFQRTRQKRDGIETIAPAQGVFLIAKPSISTGPFHHSVVLLVSHGEQGTLGLIVNRTTDILLHEAAPDLKVAENDKRTLFFGGPVVLNALMFLFRNTKPPEETPNVKEDVTTHVVEDVYFSTNRHALETLLKDKKGNDELRLYMGHAGWAPGQLQSEIERDDWELLRADADIVFQENLDEMWPELYERASSTTVAGERSVVDPIAGTLAAACLDTPLRPAPP